MKRTAMLTKSALLLSASVILALMAAFAALLLITAEQPAEATFPGANGKIVFASNRHGGWEIYTIGFAGHNLKRLTDNSAKNFAPSWSADGKRIAFSNGRRAASTYDIFVMNANGSGKTRVTKERKPGIEKWYDTAPSFSPNGHQIAFLRYDDRGRNIYKIRTDGSNLTWLSYYGDAVGSLSGPAWSPDGSKILYGVTDNDKYDYLFPPQLVTVSPDRQSHDVFVFLYAFPDLRSIGSPDWSPDGSRVVFGAEDDIYETVDEAVDGGEVQRLTTNQAYDLDPAYSPGGGKIVFSSDRDGDYDLYIKNADGSGKPQRLTNAPGADRSPSWQPIH